MSRLRFAAAGLATATMLGTAAYAQDVRKNVEPRGGGQSQAQGAPEKGMAKQGPSDRGIERGNAERAQGAPDRGPSDRGIEKRKAGQDKAQERKEAAPRGDNRKDAGRKAAQGKQDADKAAQQKRSDDATTSKTSTRRSEDRDTTKRTASPKDDASTKAASPADAGKADTTKSATAPPRTPDGKVGKDAGKTAEDSKARRGDRVQFTEAQRATIREIIVRDRPERVNVRFDVRIGVRVPRTVTLRPLPIVLISQFPSYRDYRYIYIEDRIVFVQPDTYEIVDVIEVRDTGGSRSAALTLTNDQERFVYAAVIDRGPRLSLNLRLGIGAEVPGSVEIQRFPEMVVERVPRLADYRYVIDQDQVVVLSPGDYEIALVISR